jgi:hypothetical protein
MLALLVVATAAGGAVAEEPQAPTCTAVAADCACIIPLPPAGKPVANLTEVRGDVLVSGTSGMAPPQGGTIPLPVGASVAVPGNGWARLVAAHCDKAIPEMSSLVIRPAGTCACASLVSTKPTVPVTNVQTGFSGGSTAAVVVGVTAAGGLIYLLTKEGEDNSVSP